MKNLMKKIFAPLAVFALAIGVSISVNNQTEYVGAKAATFTQITSASQISSGKKYLITTNRFNTTVNQYLPRFNSTSTAASAVTFTDISLLPDTTTWTFTSVTGGWEISQNGIKLYSTATNNGLRSSSSPSSGFIWTIEDSEASYGADRLNIKNNLSTPRFITLYQSSDWRSYTTVYTSASTQESNLVLYELQESTAVLQSISVTNPPNKINYFEGESFDKDGMVVIANYDSIPSIDVTAAIVATPNPLLEGTSSVTLSYTEGGITKTTSQAVTVTPVTLNSISISNPATKTTFSFGEPFNFEGLTISALYNNGEIIISTGFSVSGIDTMVVGQQIATVTYQEKDTSYVVDVTNEGANIGNVYATDLFISEYIEGGGNDKVIEIFNGTGSTIDLSNYSIKLGVNGATWSTTITLSGLLEHNSVFVVSNSSANANILSLSDLTTGSLTHNGDDAIGLFSEATLIDVFGILGEDPGAGWAIDVIDNATVDHVIVRKPEIISPSSAWDESQWLVYENNTISYLGNHLMDFTSISGSQQALAFADYVMTYGEYAKGSCVAVYNQLKAEYDFMATESKAIFDAYVADDSEIAPIEQQAKARYTYLAAYAAANPAAPVRKPVASETTRNNVVAVVSIGFIGLTSILGYYFINKKKSLG